MFGYWRAILQGSTSLVQGGRPRYGSYARVRHLFINRAPRNELTSFPIVGTSTRFQVGYSAGRSALLGHLRTTGLARGIITKTETLPEVSGKRPKRKSSKGSNKTETKLTAADPQRSKSDNTKTDPPDGVQAKETGKSNSKSKKSSTKYKTTKHGRLAIKPYKDLLKDLRYGRKTLPGLCEPPASHKLVTREEHEDEFIDPFNFTDNPSSSRKSVSRASTVSLDRNQFDKLELVEKRNEKIRTEIRRLEYISERLDLKRSLLGYINICVDAGLEERALRTFEMYNKRFRHFHETVTGSGALLGSPKSTGDLTADQLARERQRAGSTEPVIDESHFNALIRGFAHKGSLRVVRELMDSMEERNVPVTRETFSWKLVALMNAKSNRISHTSRKQQIRECLNTMTSRGIDLNTLLSRPFSSIAERRTIVKAIKLVIPDYKPVSSKFVSGYRGELLKGVNSVTPVVYDPLDGIKNMDSDAGADIYTDLKLRAKEQRNLERNEFTVIKSVAKPSKITSDADLRREDFKPANERERLAVEWVRLTDEYHTQLLGAFNQAREMLKRQYHNSEVMNILPLLDLLPAEEYVDSMIKEITNSAQSTDWSPPLSLLQQQLANRVMQKYFTNYRRSLYGEEMDYLYQEYLKYLADPSLRVKYRNGREYIQSAMESSGVAMPLGVSMESRRWPLFLQAALGKFLYEIILRECKIPASHSSTSSSSSSRPSRTTGVIGVHPHHAASQKSSLALQNAIRELQPAFYIASVQIGNTHKFKEELRPHPTLTRLLQAYSEFFLTFDSNELPMVSPPMPWVSPRVGGYLYQKAEFIRQTELFAQQIRKVKNTPVENLYGPLDTLNSLSLCPWRINEPILDEMLQIFRAGGNEDLDIPLNEKAMDRRFPKVTAGMTPQERGLALRARFKFRQEKREMYSLWCDCLYRLSVANHYRDRVFWFPHNFDFRGRVYPTPPHFNHLGNDVARGVLIFATGRPLGPDGLDWLKIHLVNLTGAKKQSSLAERLAYADGMMDEILDSADHPSDGRRWWATSDEPWQTLAACMEIARAVRSPDPTQYVSHFPVHQDGSCNGLQHYAALGRDDEGARSVNLLPADRPQDVYTAVCNIVERERATDAANGSKLAALLEGYIRRKTIKQTVMTTVYGVTRFGARSQIYRQLKDLGGLPDRHLWRASSYVMQKTFFSYKEIFSASKSIQDWFVACAQIISEKCHQPVQWVTPLGFPVSQPYHQHKIFNYNYVPGMASYKVEFRSNLQQKPDVRKQKNAFPPNFIHSLDSTHMMLTSLYCDLQGVTFVSVHDCFWTHPSTVAEMNRHTRRAFIELHSYPVLEDLSRSFVSTVNSAAAGSLPPLDPDTMKLLQAVPRKGNFNLEDVEKSVYFFA